MKLYSYFRSSASYRVRIALALKHLDAEIIPVNLLKNEQKSADYLALNPQGFLPALSDEGHIFSQSLAIIEYLEDTHPTPALLPKAPAERARVRAIALAIACDTSPLNNLSVLNHLQTTYQISDAEKTAWIQHWIHKGFTAVEALLHDGKTGSYCHGNSPGLADCVLIPQLFNAQRFGCDLSAFPTITRIGETCALHPAFISAHPSKQIDAA